MTLYASRELSKKLEKMGCVSVEGRIWYPEPSFRNEPDCFMFSPLDFIGCTDVARENCRKIWGDGELKVSSQMYNDPPFEWSEGKMIDIQRKHLVYLPTETDFWTYIEEALGSNDL